MYVCMYVCVFVVVAIDIDPVKIACAMRNAEVYGVRDRIEFIVGDFFNIMPKLKVNLNLPLTPLGRPVTSDPCSMLTWCS